jgi:hypothetical protein
MGLPKHHLRTTLELLATTSVTSSIDSAENSEGWAGADFSRICNSEDLHQFIGVCDYLFDYLGSDE